MCAGTEGWVQLVMMKYQGFLRLATSSYEECREWTRFLYIPPEERDAKLSQARNANRPAAVNGFLWFGTDVSSPGFLRVHALTSVILQ